MNSSTTYEALKCFQKHRSLNQYSKTVQNRHGVFRSSKKKKKEAIKYVLHTLVKLPVLTECLVVNWISFQTHCLRFDENMLDGYLVLGRFILSSNE